MPLMMMMVMVMNLMLSMFPSTMFLSLGAVSHFLFVFGLGRNGRRGRDAREHGSLEDGGDGEAGGVVHAKPRSGHHGQRGGHVHTAAGEASARPAHALDIGTAFCVQRVIFFILRQECSIF